MRNLLTLTIVIVFHLLAKAQPEIPVEQWKNKTILLIAAHPDDDLYSMGTLAMLNANGNRIYELILTTGNVGTHDPKLGKMDLAKIRKQEEQDALRALGIPPENYIKVIRQLQPDVLFAFDPGKGYQRWHKADHRSASYLAADAVRAAMWPLMFQGHIAIDGLQAHEIQEFVLFDSSEEDINMIVDITNWEERKVNALSKYVSQFSSGLYDYQGPEISAKELKTVRAKIHDWMPRKDGKPIEGFRYYKGSVENIGR